MGVAKTGESVSRDVVLVERLQGFVPEDRRAADREAGEGSHDAYRDRVNVIGRSNNLVGIGSIEAGPSRGFLFTHEDCAVRTDLSGQVSAAVSPLDPFPPYGGRCPWSWD